MYRLILVKVCNDIDVCDHLWMYVMRLFVCVGIGRCWTTANNKHGS
jgi:hypothetical protein